VFPGQGKTSIQATDVRSVTVMSKDAASSSANKFGDAVRFRQANPHRGTNEHGRSCGESRRGLEFSHLP
jgi:hypothetical protein